MLRARNSRSWQQLLPELGCEPGGAATSRFRRVLRSRPPLRCTQSPSTSTSCTISRCSAGSVPSARRSASSNTTASVASSESRHRHVRNGDGAPAGRVLVDDVAQDRQQPCARMTPVEAAQRPVRAHERVLDEVLGHVAPAGQRASRAVQPADLRCDESVERRVPARDILFDTDHGRMEPSARRSIPRRRDHGSTPRSASPPVGSAVISYDPRPCHSNRPLRSSPAAPPEWAKPRPGGSPPRARTSSSSTATRRKGEVVAKELDGTFVQADVTDEAQVQRRGRRRDRDRSAAHVHPLRGRRLGRAHDQPRRHAARPRDVPQDRRDQPHRHVQRAAARGVGHERATSPTTTASVA